MHKLNGIIAGITIRGLTSPARLELGEPRDASLRMLRYIADRFCIIGKLEVDRPPGREKLGIAL